MKVVFDDKEEVDDLYAQDAQVRIERMGDDFFWLWIKETDGTEITIHLISKRAIAAKKIE